MNYEQQKQSEYIRADIRDLQRDIKRLQEIRESRKSQIDRDILAYSIDMHQVLIDRLIAKLVRVEDN